VLSIESSGYILPEHPVKPPVSFISRPLDAGPLCRPASFSISVGRLCEIRATSFRRFPMEHAIPSNTSIPGTILDLCFTVDPRARSFQAGLFFGFNTRLLLFPCQARSRQFALTSCGAAFWHACGFHNSQCSTSSLSPFRGS